MCPPSASRGRARTCGVRGLLPLFAAWACPGVLLASTYMRRRHPADILAFAGNANLSRAQQRDLPIGAFGLCSSPRRQGVRPFGMRTTIGESGRRWKGSASALTNRREPCTNDGARQRTGGSAGLQPCENKTARTPPWLLKSQHVFDFLDFALTLLRRRLPPKAYRDHGSGKIAGDVRRRGLVSADKWR